MARREEKNTTQRRPEDWFPSVRAPGTASTDDISGKVDNTREIIAGTGLTGGGDLSADVTLNIDTSAEAERIRDVIGVALVAGANVTVTVNDAGDTITIDASAPAGYTDEQVRDVIGAALVAGTGITVTVNDPADTITITSSITQYTDEMAEDAIAAIISAGTQTGITVTYDDANNKLSFSVTVASDVETWTGTENAKATTPKTLKDAATPVAVSYAATITLDGNTGLNFEIGSLTGAVTFANPTNMQAGDSGTIRIPQDGTGGRVASWGTNWKFPGGVASGGVLSTTASTVDLVSYTVSSTGEIIAVLSKAFAH